MFGTHAFYLRKKVAFSFLIYLYIILEVMFNVRHYLKIPMAKYFFWAPTLIPIHFILARDTSFPKNSTSNYGENSSFF